jgi:tetratricopeptide (TPR) repeat protein
MLTCCLLLFSVFRLQAADSWWNDEWTLRRSVTVSDTVRGASPAEGAFVEFPTLGKINPDGSDIRVIDKSGNEVPVTIMASGLEDRACILFEAHGKGTYTLYFGNPKAKPGARNENLHAGLMLESRELAEGNVNNWKEMQQVLIKSSKVTGRWWTQNTTMGMNPLGPWDHGIAIFSGYIRAPMDGSYTFATNSNDASFILIDDKEVASWPCWHNAGGGEHGAHNGKVDLKVGLHRFEYINAFRGFGVCEVGWQRPSDPHLVPMTSDCFAGVLLSKVGQAETKTGATADFEWMFDDDLGMEGRLVTSVKFSPFGQPKNCQWDFGDGTTSNAFAPSHIFLEAGFFTVTLDADGKKATQKVRVQPTLGHRNRQYEKRLSAYAEAIRNYPAEKLSIPACLEMGQICHEAHIFDSAAKAYRAALEKDFIPRDGEQQYWVVQRLYEIYRDNGRYDDAIWVCDHIAQQKDVQPQTAAQALDMKAEILYDWQDKNDAADQVCKLVLQKYKQSNSDYVRWACIRMGELALARGDVKTAKKILDDTEHSDLWKKWSGDFEFENGAHELNFEEYMRQTDYEGAWREIIWWEWERPTIKLSGLTRHMRGRVFLARKMYELAIREFNRGLAVDKQAPFADEALYWKGQAFEALKQIDKAADCYSKLLKDYPASKLVARVKEKLK